MRGHNNLLFEVKVAENEPQYYSYQIRYSHSGHGYDYEIEVITLSNSYCLVDGTFSSCEDAMNAAHRIGRAICYSLTRILHEKI